MVADQLGIPLGLLQFVPEGGRIPAGYGVVLRTPFRYGTITAPIPLNLVFRAAALAYWAAVQGLWHSKFERLLMNAWVDGWKTRANDELDLKARRP